MKDIMGCSGYSGTISTIWEPMRTLYFEALKTQWMNIINKKIEEKKKRSIYWRERSKMSFILNMLNLRVILIKAGD